LFSFICSRLSEDPDELEPDAMLRPLLFPGGSGILLLEEDEDPEENALGR